MPPPPWSTGKGTIPPRYSNPTGALGGACQALGMSFTRLRTRGRVIGWASAAPTCTFLLYAVTSRNLEQLGVSVVVGDAIRSEENRRAVWGKCLHQIGAGMPGQSFGDAALHGHDVDIRIALVLRAERHQAPIRREGGMR